MRDPDWAGCLEDEYQARNATPAYAEKLNRSTIIHALAELAYAVGEDCAGDALRADLDDALYDDGIDLDDRADAIEAMDGDHDTPEKAMRTLAAYLNEAAEQEARRVERAAARAAGSVM